MGNFMSSRGVPNPAAPPTAIDLTKFPVYQQAKAVITIDTEQLNEFLEKNQIELMALSKKDELVVTANQHRFDLILPAATQPLGMGIWDGGRGDGVTYTATVQLACVDKVVRKLARRINTLCPLLCHWDDMTSESYAKQFRVADMFVFDALGNRFSELPAPLLSERLYGGYVLGREGSTSPCSVVVTVCLRPLSPSQKVLLGDPTSILVVDYVKEVPESLKRLRAAQELAPSTQ